MASQAKRTKPTGPGPRVGHLDSLSGILKEMGNVYREMRQGSTAITDGSRLIYSLRCMRDVIETIALERLEERLDQLQGEVDQRNGIYGNTTHRQQAIGSH
jgi:hypothetical protein